jgi:DNA-binding transcriptional ArsR family regulator
MGGILDHDTVERLIRQGRVEELSSSEIADQIIALTEDTARAKAMSHPMRSAILQLLREGPSSPSRAAARLDGHLPTVAYHFKALERLELIEVRERTAKRGAIEHIYQLKE